MNKKFGVKLKELRTERHLTQQQLAQILKVSKTTVCQWETLKQEPDMDNIVFLAKYFGVTTDYLLGMDDEDDDTVAP